MKKVQLVCFLFILGALNLKAQVATPESLAQEIEKLNIDSKNLQGEISILQKQVSSKKVQAIKEVDKQIADILKAEAAQLEEQVKQKKMAGNTLKKQLAEKQKLLSELKKQKAAPNTTIINPNIKNLPIGNNSKIVGQIIQGDYVEIFEQPSYTGKSVKYYINKLYENVTMPFSSNAISIKFSNENKIILFFAEENPTQLINGEKTNTLRTLIASTPLFTINTTNIVTVLVGTKRKIEVDFNGFIYAPYTNYSYSIHNDDCKRIYGTVDYNLTMTLGGRIRTHPAKDYLLSASTATPVENVSVFNQPKNNAPVCSFVYNASTEANLTPRVGRERGGGFSRTRHTALYSVPDLPRAKQYFYVDSASYQYYGAGKYQFEATIKIGSAHKGCPICTDFTWDAEMLTEEKIKFKLPNDWQQEVRGVPGVLDYDYIQIGPFRGLGRVGERRGERPGGNINPDNFKGPEHPTYVQFIIKGSQRN